MFNLLKFCLQPGQHQRELNPYWKDGGTGLPEELPPKNDVLDGTTGDAGLGWLHKAMQRCIEMAKEENRTVEEVVAERHGVSFCQLLMLSFMSTKGISCHN